MTLLHEIQRRLRDLGQRLGMAELPRWIGTERGIFLYNPEQQIPVEVKAMLLQIPNLRIQPDPNLPKGAVYFIRTEPMERVFARPRILRGDPGLFLAPDV